MGENNLLVALAQHRNYNVQSSFSDVGFYLVEWGTAFQKIIFT